MQLLNHLVSLEELLPHREFVVVLQELVELVARVYVFEFDLDLLREVAVDLDDDCHRDVDKDEDDDDPERDEKQSVETLVPASLQGDRHVDDHEPVVDDHLLEKDDERRGKVVEIQQIVEGRRCHTLVSLEGQRTAEDELSEVGVLVVDEVDEKELAQNGFRQQEAGLEDEVNGFDFAKVP